jgi:large subunit ribosomal protein L24
MAGIKKGDTVAVLGGKDRGKTGKVLQVWPQRGRALVERINLSKHFERRTQQNQAGGIVERESALPISKLGLYCQKCKRPSRPGWLNQGDGSKQRICRRCKGVLS